MIGPPGSGKTTYCWGVQQYLQACGRYAGPSGDACSRTYVLTRPPAPWRACLRRSVAVVNLDPANDRLPYKAAVDVMELISCTDVMARLDLGPNGSTCAVKTLRQATAALMAGRLPPTAGLVYCMEYLESHLDWLRDRLAALKGVAFAARPSSRRRCATLMPAYLSRAHSALPSARLVCATLTPASFPVPAPRSPPPVSSAPP